MTKQERLDQFNQAAEEYTKFPQNSTAFPNYSEMTKYAYEFRELIIEAIKNKPDND